MTAVVQGVQRRDAARSADVHAPIRVLVVDDHRLARIALVCLLNQLTGVAVAGEVADVPSAEALERLVAEQHADVVIRRSFDREAPTQTSGATAGFSRFATIILSGTESPEDVQTAFAGGANGFLVESRVPEHLAAALRAVVDGGRFLDPELGARLFADAADGRRATRGAVTRRERQVLALLAAGKTNDEIALELGISPRTVEGHRTRVGRKLGLRRRAELIEYALLHRLRPAQAAPPAAPASSAISPMPRAGGERG